MKKKMIRCGARQWQSGAVMGVVGCALLLSAPPALLVMPGLASARGIIVGGSTEAEPSVGLAALSKLDVQADLDRGDAVNDVARCKAAARTCSCVRDLCQQAWSSCDAKAGAEKNECLSEVLAPCQSKLTQCQESLMDRCSVPFMATLDRQSGSLGPPKGPSVTIAGVTIERNGIFYLMSAFFTMLALLSVRPRPTRQRDRLALALSPTPARGVPAMQPARAAVATARVAAPVFSAEYMPSATRQRW